MHLVGFIIKRHLCVVIMGRCYYTFLERNFRFVITVDSMHVLSCKCIIYMWQLNISIAWFIFSRKYRRIYLIWIVKSHIMQEKLMPCLGDYVNGFHAFSSVTAISIWTMNLYPFFWVIPRSQNFICRRFGTHCSIFFLRIPHVKLKLTECSETSAYKFHTPKNHPKERIQHSEHVESVKSRTMKLFRMINHVHSTIQKN